MSLTNSATPDAPALTSGNDTITGATGTLAAADRLIDPSGSDEDVATIAVGSYAAGVTPTMINVEKVNINGDYLTTGLALTNVTGTKTLTLATGITGGTATVIDAAATKAATITASTNVATINVTALAAGTAGTVTVNGGSATANNVTGGAGNDTFVVTTAAGAAITLDDTGATTGDNFTVNVSGGSSNFTITTGSAIENMTINSNTADTTLTLQNANKAVGTATGNKLVLGGTKNITITGNADFLNSAAVGTNVVVEKAAGTTGILTFNATGKTTTASDFVNRAAFDVLAINYDEGALAIPAYTVNENTTVKFGAAQTTAAVTLNIDNAAGTLATSALTGTLKMETGTTAYTHVGITTGAQVATATLKVDANTTITTLTDNAALETFVVTGSKNLTITTWANAANDVLTASALTGNLTVGATSATGVIVGGEGADSITLGDFTSVVQGGAGNDTISAAALTAGKTASLFGNAGNDLLTGGADNDTINGGEGNDTITGAGGTDSLTGGAGDDVFVFAAANFAATTAAALGTAADIITDFTSGSDKIDFGATNLGIVAHTAAAAAGTASISATGLAAFHSSDTTLTQKVTAVFSAFATDAAGTSAVFVHGSDTYLAVVGDNTAGIQATDALIKLVGITAATGLVANPSGDIITIA